MEIETVESDDAPMFVSVHPDDLTSPVVGGYPAQICSECKCLTENWHQVIVREEMTVTMMVLGFSPTTEFVVKCQECIRKQHESDDEKEISPQE